MPCVGCGKGELDIGLVVDIYRYRKYSILKKKGSIMKSLDIFFIINKASFLFKNLYRCCIINSTPFQIANVPRKSAARAASAKIPDNANAIPQMPPPPADVARRVATPRGVTPRGNAAATRSRGQYTH